MFLFDERIGCVFEKTFVRVFEYLNIIDSTKTPINPLKNHLTAPKSKVYIPFYSQKDRNFMRCDAHNPKVMISTKSVYLKISSTGNRFYGLANRGLTVELLVSLIFVGGIWKAMKSM